MLSATIQNIENMPAFKAAGANAVIVGLDAFSLASAKDISLDEVKIWHETAKKIGLNLLINMRAMIHEEKLAQLNAALDVLKEECEGIYYGDEGLYYLAAQKGMAEKLIYQPETLVTNAMDVSYYLSLGIQSVSLAHELSLQEIESIASKQKNVEVLAQGYYSILYSRRPLVSNYLNVIKAESGLQHLQIQEQTRQNKMPIIQNEQGTLVFSDAPQNSAAQIAALKQAGIHRFRIDGLFYEDDTVLEWIKAYHALLQGKDAKVKEGDDTWYHQVSLTRKEDGHGQN